MSSAEVAAYETFVNHCELHLHLCSDLSLTLSTFLPSFLPYTTVSSPSSSIPIYLAQKLPLLYPDLHPAIILDRCFDPVAYARSPSQVLEGTTIERLGDGLAGISFDEYVPASRRRDGKGKIVGKDAFARWEMSWKKERFLIIVVNVSSLSASTPYDDPQVLILPFPSHVCSGIPIIKVQCVRPSSSPLPMPPHQLSTSPSPPSNPLFRTTTWSSSSRTASSTQMKTCTLRSRRHLGTTLCSMQASPLVSEPSTAAS
jgi:hypothetical protein